LCLCVCVYVCHVLGHVLWTRALVPVQGLWCHTATTALVLAQQPS